MGHDDEDHDHGDDEDEDDHLDHDDNHHDDDDVQLTCKGLGRKGLQKKLVRSPIPQALLKGLLATVCYIKQFD